MSEKGLALTLKNLLLTGIVGWITSLYTLWHRAKVQAGLDIGESFCNINAAVNCDTVALSQYSEFGGVSVPTLGLIYFTIAILLALRTLKQQRAGGVGELTRRSLLYFAASGAVGSIALAILSATQIGAFCLVCSVVHLLTFLFFYLSWRISRAVRQQPARPERLEGVTVVFFLVAVGLQFLIEPAAKYAAQSSQIDAAETLPPQLREQILRQFNNETSYEISPQQSPVVGPAGATITLVEFSDFECPHCALTHKQFPQILAPFKDQVRVIYKNFPLDPSCNSGGGHRHACYAARAARCVYKRKGLEPYLKVKNALFANNHALSKDSIKEKAITQGLSASEFEACVDSNEIQQEIRDEIDLAKSLGVSGTPTLFVNGKLLSTAASPGVLKAILSDLLKK